MTEVRVVDPGMHVMNGSKSRARPQRQRQRHRPAETVTLSNTYRKNWMRVHSAATTTVFYDLANAALRRRISRKLLDNLRHWLALTTDVSEVMAPPFQNKFWRISEMYEF